jgi:hypothetical protein
MKKTILVALTAGAIAFQAGTAVGQAPHIDPLTGMPVTHTGGAAHIDPRTGMPASKSDERTPWTAIQDASQTQANVQKLIYNNQYDEALQQCLAYHDKYKTGSTWSILLPEWIELGRRYPAAKTALLGIRDHDTAEFSANRGYSELFTEIYTINSALDESTATYELFKSFRVKDPQLAQQCYGTVEGVLVAQGDYRWCYDHMGDPHDKLDSIHNSMTMQLEQAKHASALAEESNARMAEMNRRFGRTNAPAFLQPDPSATMKASAEKSFVGQTRLLIEILIATGHKKDAEEIRDEAIGVRDDARLKSAVADAEAKLRKGN